MSELKPAYQSGADAFADWQESIRMGDAPKLYLCGEGQLADFEIGPGRVMLIGGAPGGGKTALTMQLMADALQLNPSLKVLVCNIEMSIATLLDRQLARFSGIPADIIRKREITDANAEYIESGMEQMGTFIDRLAFVKSPYNLQNVAMAADDFNADVIVLDYIQRILPPGNHQDKRGSVDATMDWLRKFAEADRAIVVVSALSRGKDSKGRSSYDAASMSLASFKETSELEYGVDDAYIVIPDVKDDTQVTLRHLKSRHGAMRDIPLTFERDLQRFTPMPEAVEWVWTNNPEGHASADRGMTG